MKTIEVKLYSFDELSEEAKQNAIERVKNIENYLDYNWYDSVYDIYHEKIKESGFDIEKIYFSGFWSQGDGAMFEYSRLFDELKHEFIKQLDLSEMRKNWLRNNIYISGKGSHSGLYYHSKCCNHSIYWEIDNGNLHWSTTFYKWLESFQDDFEDFVTEKYEDLCSDLYQALEREYEYLMSDEHIYDFLSQDDYTEYTEEGEIY